ncbi:MAG: PAS domain S-box-containing protein [Myxococcota bacterium]|jgi:PAS domain S-box-containing protein
MEHHHSIEDAKLAQHRLEALALENELFRRAQVELEAERDENLSLFENAPVGFLVLEPSGAIRRANQRGAKALGVAPSGLIDQSFLQFVSPLSEDSFAEHLVFVDGKKIEASNDLLMLRANGGSFWARTRSAFSPAGTRQSAGIILTIDEIDDRVMDMHSQIEASPSAQALAPVAMADHCGCILLVDDDELAVNALARVLHRMGYEIATFTDPEEALAAFRESPNDYDAVITDYQMPGMNGIALCEKLRTIKPELPLLLTSADTSEIDPVRAKEVGVEHMLPKPFSAEELSQWLEVAVPDEP